MTTGGVHLIADFRGCGRPADDAQGAAAAIRAAVDAMGATLLELNAHAFSPHGFTAVAILAESHLAVHSWPERGYVAVDVFTCGETLRPEAGIEVLRRFFEPQDVAVQRIERGKRDGPARREMPLPVEADSDAKG